MNADQQGQLQTIVQRELEEREWAEPGDNVMAEYITVLLANGSTKDRVQKEMDDLVGADFDARFLDWLFDTAQDITRPEPEPTPAPSRSPVGAQRSASSSSAAGSSRILNHALAPLSHQAEKRKYDDRSGGDFESNKRRTGDVPSGPRGMGMSGEGRSLADRLGPGRGGGRGGFSVRGMAGGRGPAGAGSGFRPNGGMGMGMGMNQQQQQHPHQQPGQPGGGFGFFPPGQQEMMAQMMMMQASMAQMGQMMSQMAKDKEQAQAAAMSPGARPVRPTPARIPHGTKLGGHSVSVVPPKRASSPGPIPDKPTSKALCRYSVGCSNSRCTYSHPSPVADEKTGMVLSEDACEDGKACKDPECIKSHVSPAAVHGEAAGPSRMLCKYQNCTNPSCQFRHEDENGNPIPPPALTAAKQARSAARPTVASAAPADTNMSDNEDGDVEVVMSSKGLMDGPLDEKAGGGEKQCRYGERCTRADCKFSHPATRPIPRGGKAARKPSASNGVGSQMNVSKKFGAGASANKTLNPTAGSFTPTAAAAQASAEV